MDEISGRERKALARWRPQARWHHPLMGRAVITLSRFVMRGMNSLAIEGLERFVALKERGGRGLLTFCNHVSLFDDPLLISNLPLGRYRDVRWVGADALNFFGSPFKAWVFTAGKSVPIVRGAGTDQPGLDFLCQQLRDGGWVHMFPEGGRTRDPQALMTHPLKSGIGRLIAEAQPIALPFYHYGMHQVLPLGAKVPRRGKRVRLMFGEAIDCDADWVGSHEQTGAARLESIAESAHESLAGLERELNPASLHR
jgi:1-acyl-sn-glycerol-3-phosphate acyltransferase